MSVRSLIAGILDKTTFADTLPTDKVEQAIQKRIVVARDYYEGKQHVPLTSRQKKFLGFKEDGRFAVNYCKLVLQAVLEKLVLEGMTLPDYDPEVSTEEQATVDWVDAFTKTVGLARLQHVVHKRALRDGTYYVFVDLPEEEKPDYPVLRHHPRYVSERNGGSGFGIRMVYPHDDPEQEALYAEKLWTEDAEGEKVRRMNRYYPERIERYQMEKGKWVLIEEPQEWTTPSGEPLGIPIIEFANVDHQPEIHEVIPLQDAVNKAVIDALAAADIDAFRILVASGFYPTLDSHRPATDGSNVLKLAPGSWVIIPPELAQNGAKVDVIEGGSVVNSLTLADNLVLKIAQISDTPLSRFQISGQVAAEGTLKQQENALNNKVRARQDRFGAAWERVFLVARQMMMTLRPSLNLDTTLELKPKWEPIEQKDEKDEIDMLATKKRDLGVPKTQIWLEAGYTSAQIERWRKENPEVQLAEQAAFALLEGGRMNPYREDSEDEFSGK